MILPPGAVDIFQPEDDERAILEWHPERCESADEEDVLAALLEHVIVDSEVDYAQQVSNAEAGWCPCRSS